MKIFAKLEPEVAIASLRKNPSSVYCTIDDIRVLHGLTEREMITELASGRLVAVGIPNKNGYSDVRIRGDDYLAWRKRFQ